MTCNISVSVMSILLSLPFMFIYLLCMKKVYSIQLWYYLYSRILRTFVNISSAKEEKVRRSFFRKDRLYFSFKLLSLFFFRTVLFKYDPGRRFTRSFFLNQTHKFYFLISPLPRLSRTKSCNCFLRMKKGIRFLLCIFTEWICYNES